MRWHDPGLWTSTPLAFAVASISTTASEVPLGKLDGAESA
jgi:hypothetical protein